MSLSEDPLCQEAIRFPVVAVSATRGKLQMDIDPGLTALTILTILIGMKIEQIGTLEAKTRLSELLDKVERGQRFQITRHGKAIAELSPVAVKRKKRRFGCGKGLVSYIAPDFDEPLVDFQEYME